MDHAHFSSPCSTCTHAPFKERRHSQPIHVKILKLSAFRFCTTVTLFRSWRARVPFLLVPFLTHTDARLQRCLALSSGSTGPDPGHLRCSFTQDASMFPILVLNEFVLPVPSTAARACPLEIRHQSRFALVKPIWGYTCSLKARCEPSFLLHPC